MATFFSRALSFLSFRSRTRSSSSSSGHDSSALKSPTQQQRKEDNSSLFRKTTTSGPLSQQQSPTSICSVDHELKQLQIRDAAETFRFDSRSSDDCRLFRDCSRSTCSTVLIHEDECVLCLEEFSSTNPQICTLCSCGENRTKFHYPCLLMWLEKKPVCPTCDAPMFYQEGVYHCPEE